ncbi:MAG TPA: hypothetical protein VK753_03990, partial [Xanthomonadaceae bacterium]|nr:hypothetical protein [Xanthomonadaceae bacterium]
GGEKTAPLRVLVDQSSPSSAGSGSQTDAQPTARSGNSGDPVFIESSIAPEKPYVGQATIYTLRLYYGVALLDAALDVPNGDNGDLRQVGTDERSSVVVQGHRYDVLERHYLLQPEHSGSLHISAPVFQGRTLPDLNSVFDDSLGDGGLRALGKAIDVQVRPRPAQAGDPWLPAQSVQLTVDPLPSMLRAGEPFSVVVHEVGEGVSASQLPEISLPAIAGAQVYPEPSSTIERARAGSLQAERTRRFAIVVDHAGRLHLPDLTLPWWDLGNDRAALARVALPQLQVQPGSVGQGAVDANASKPDGVATTAQATGSGLPSIASRGWQVATFVLAALLALALAWGWRRGQADSADASAHDGGSDMQAPRSTHALIHALIRGEPAAIAQALCEAAPAPRPQHLREVAQRLDDPAQRDAVLAFDATRWSGDGLPSAQALAQLRTAFARAPRWTAPAKSRSHADALPPLYPE